MSKAKAIRTIADLQSALLLLIGGDGRAEGKRHVVEAVGNNSRSTTTFFVGVIYWRHPPAGSDSLYVSEIGDTPADAYRKCCLKIRENLEERTQRQRLEREQPPAAMGHRTLRLTYQPEGQS